MDNANIENLKLPQTVVSRLIKEALPAGVNVSKEVKVAIARSAAIFVLHTTNYANESAKDHKRKNITAADVLSAVKILDCEELEKPIMEALQLFKAQKNQRLEQRKRRQTGDDSASLTSHSTPSKTSKRTTDDDNASGQSRQAESSNRGHEAGGGGEVHYEEVEDESEHRPLNDVDDEMDSQRPFL